MRWPAAALGLAVACSAAQARTPDRRAAGTASARPAPADPRPAAPVSASASPPRAAPSAGPSRAAPPEPPRRSHEATAAQNAAACPPGMQLVEGDYCTDVEHECLRSWFDESNRKTVCERFAEKATCKGERVHKRYCIDRWSWPNEKGARPEVMNNFYQAQVKCAAVGRRMCTESEWTFACEGPEMKPFPYGWVRDPEKCNGDRAWDSPNMNEVARRDPEELARLWQGVPNGAQPDCVSDFGIADLPGNTDDVVANETTTPAWRAKYSSVNTGGPWYKGVRNQCRPKIYTHEEGFYYYYLGFRCCAGADGAANEPRTPMQARSKTRWETVERLARFTVAEMKAKLEEKRRGECVCRATDVLCKTMCGTLLGPSAVDVVLRPGAAGGR